MLLQKRSSIKDSWPDYWDISCAGHIESGHNAIDTAIRELNEELGLVITNPSDLIKLGTVCIIVIYSLYTYIEFIGFVTPSLPGHPPLTILVFFPTSFLLSLLLILTLDSSKCDH